MPAGIKLKANKSAARAESIQNLPVPDKVILYTSQHIGAPSQVTVEKRQEIKKGQIVASLKGGCSSALHSPIAGTVKEIATVNMCGGRSGEAIIIKKGDSQKKEFMKPLENPSPDKIKKRIEKAGIIGMGGAGFPSHMKLSPPKSVDIAFLNGCECEPLLTADERLMIEESKKIIKGFALLKKAVGAEKGIIGIEKDKTFAIEKMKEALSARVDMEILVLDKVYPQGYEKMLITRATGREVPPGKLPFDVGVTVHNASTCFAVCEAAYEGKPLIERIVTVSGEGIQEPANYRAPLGMVVEDILGYCMKKETPEKEVDVYMGGPMMGVSLDSLDYGILKTTSGIILQNPFFRKEAPCIKCGRCVEACPMGLYPQRMNMLHGAGEFKKMSEAGLDSCMECGCCSYMCPSEICLTEKFKEAKEQI